MSHKSKPKSFDDWKGGSTRKASFAVNPPYDDDAIEAAVRRGNYPGDYNPKNDPNFTHMCERVALGLHEKQLRASSEYPAPPEATVQLPTGAIQSALRHAKNVARGVTWDLGSVTKPQHFSFGLSAEQGFAAGATPQPAGLRPAHTLSLAGVAGATPQPTDILPECIFAPPAQTNESLGGEAAPHESLGGEAAQRKRKIKRRRLTAAAPPESEEDMKRLVRLNASNPDWIAPWDEDWGEEDGDEDSDEDSDEDEDEDSDEDVRLPDSEDEDEDEDDHDGCSCRMCRFRKNEKIISDELEETETRVHVDVANVWRTTRGHHAIDILTSIHSKATTSSNMMRRDMCETFAPLKDGDLSCTQLKKWNDLSHRLNALPAFVNNELRKQRNELQKSELRQSVLDRASMKQINNYDKLDAHRARSAAALAAAFVEAPVANIAALTAAPTKRTDVGAVAESVRKLNVSAGQRAAAADKTTQLRKTLATQSSLPFTAPKTKNKTFRYAFATQKPTAPAGATGATPQPKMAGRAGLRPAQTLSLAGVAGATPQPKSVAGRAGLRPAQTLSLAGATPQPAQTNILVGRGEAPPLVGRGEAPPHFGRGVAPPAPPAGSAVFDEHRIPKQCRRGDGCRSRTCRFAHTTNQLYLGRLASMQSYNPTPPRRPAPTVPWAAGAAGAAGAPPQPKMAGAGLRPAQTLSLRESNPTNGAGLRPAQTNILVGRGEAPPAPPSSRECPVCFVEMDGAYALLCGHVFCADCVGKIKKSCFVCSATVDKPPIRLFM